VTHGFRALALGLILFGLSATASAEARHFDGGYAGAGATFDNFNPTGPGAGGTVTGVGGTILLGYDLSFGDAGFIGVEANGDVSTADAVGIAATYGGGVSLRAGFAVSDHSAIYVRAGYQRDRVVFTGNSDWVAGLRLGGGAEFGVTDHLSIRAEYNHLKLQRKLKNDQAVMALIYAF
jgi:outer membrane immunogenic protein